MSNITTINETMSINEKILSIPMNTNIAIENLTNIYTQYKKNGVYLSIVINSAIESFQREFSLKNISEVLKSSHWKEKFNLDIEDRMIRSYNRTGKFNKIFLSKGIEIPPSKLEKYCSILEKKEYKDVLLNSPEILASVINSPTIDPLLLEDVCINEFSKLDKPTIDSPLPQVMAYKENSLKVSANHAKIEKAKNEKNEKIVTKEKTYSFTEIELKSLLSSCEIQDDKIQSIITFLNSK
jgi:hypothetical protein